MDFVQLQVKSSYSLLQSTITIDKLIEKAVSYGYQALALTDKNVLYGALEFYEKAKASGIKPILGLEITSESTGLLQDEYPLLLLAKSKLGFQNLMKLSTDYHLSESSLTLKQIQEYSTDLVVVSPGINGEVLHNFDQSDLDQAQKVYRNYQELFDDFYVGIHKGQGGLAQTLTELSIPLLALEDVQYLDPEDEYANNVLKIVDGDESVELEHKEEVDRSLKPIEKIVRDFSNIGLSQAVQNTVKVADSVDIDLDYLGEQFLPEFKVPDTYTSDSYLQKLASEGLEKKVQDVTQVYRDRLEYELTVISSMGFSDYFLIVWDVMNYAHSKSVTTGAGRGSAAASLVAYSLDITDIDPIEYDLLFERFLNKDRFTLPDIDLDFPDNKRDNILHYVNEKYGSEYVAQIATFGTYAAKLSLRDVGRVFGLDSTQLKEWSNAVPNTLKITLDQAFKDSKKMQVLVGRSDRNKQIFDTAKRIEGLPRHVSTHAAGVVISKLPLVERVPLQKGSGDLLRTQFTMEDVEKSGLLKMDFLGLKNLTILHDAKTASAYENNKKVTEADIPLDDEKTLKIFQQGYTDGVFQFESSGIKRVLRQMKPNSFEDIVAVNALYRPGPMEQISTFIDRKNGQEPITYPHEDLESILKVTYGIMVYQEQVMQVASKMAGYSLSEADQLRRAISKKIHKEMDEGRKKFVQGALQKGYQEQVANEVYDYIVKFADYGFNKAHATAYSMVAYQLAYFKAHYPLSFYTAIFRAYGANKTKFNQFVLEVKDRGLKITGPKINQSSYDFIVLNKTVNMGLNYLKGINKNFVHQIILERKQKGSYKNLNDFLIRVPIEFLKIDQIEILIKAGVFDDILEVNRASALKSLEGIIESIKMSQGQQELFGIAKPRMQRVEEFEAEQLAEFEKEYTGLFFSPHPTTIYDEYRNQWQIKYLMSITKGKEYNVLGKIEAIKVIKTKKGIPMSFVEISDETGKISLTLFPQQHRQYIQNLSEGEVLIAKGKVEEDSHGKKMLVDKLFKPEELIRKTLYLQFNDLQQENARFTETQTLLKKYPGNSQVIVYDKNSEKAQRLKRDFNVDLDSELIGQLNDLLGSDNIAIK